MRHNLALVLVVAAALFAAGSPCFGAFWDIEPVYSEGFASGDTSLALGPGSIPSISYTANGTLYLATKTELGWAAQSVASVGFWGGFASARFNSVGQACIAFIDATAVPANRLNYAYRTSSAWTIETVETDLGWQPEFVSLDFTPSGQACIAYCKTVGAVAYLCFARRTGVNTWVRQQIAQIGSITGPSLAIDASGRSYVSFAESASGRLKVASAAAGGAWTVEDVDGGSAAPAVWYSWIMLQPDGDPAVAYFIASGEAVLLKCACRAQSGWTSETAATLAAGAACYCSLTVTAQGIPLICYNDPATRSFRNAWKAGGGWFTETIDDGPQTGVRPCSRLDAIGNVQASYFDSRNASIKYAWALTPVSLADARSMPDGQTVQMSGVVASTASADLASALYVQQWDRSAGMKLQFTGQTPVVARGTVLDVQGQLSTADGERVIADPVLSQPWLLQAR